MKIISLVNNRGEFIVDDEDYERVDRYRWYLTGRYATTMIQRTTIYAARFILGILVGEKVYVDHINFNTLDNRKENLRVCSSFQSSLHRRTHKDNSSKFKGVSWNKNVNKWQARIGDSWLGLFVDEIEAALAYDAAAHIKHGEFAKLNFSK